MAQLADLSYRQLAWCTTWYLREETLQPAIASIVNHHYRHPLARLWGGGTLSSSDGQRFPVAVRSPTATAIPRYYGFGTGLTFYTWTSDQSSQYGSKPIPSTVRDSTYVLDGVLDNETELPIAEHTTDTAGYTDLVFGFFDLLGLQFSPRLRDLADQTLYRIDKSIRYQHIGLLVRGAIKPRLFLAHWDDLLRAAGSLKLGWARFSLHRQATVVSAQKRADTCPSRIRSPEQNDLHPAVSAHRASPAAHWNADQQGRSSACLARFPLSCKRGQDPPPALRRAAQPSELPQFGNQCRRALEYSLHERCVRSAKSARLPCR
jgi:Tn3 transposase DDE domain